MEFYNTIDMDNHADYIHPTDNEDPWRNLANAVIINAVNDYMSDSVRYWQIKNNRHYIELDKKGEVMAEELKRITGNLRIIRKFFHESEWMEIFCPISGDAVIKALDERINDKIDALAKEKDGADKVLRRPKGRPRKVG